MRSHYLETETKPIISRYSITAPTQSTLFAREQHYWHFNRKYIVRFTWPTWGPPGSCSLQVGPMLPPELCYQKRLSIWTTGATWNNNIGITTSLVFYCEYVYIQLLYAAFMLYSVMHRHQCVDTNKKTKPMTWFISNTRYHSVCRLN